MLIYPKPNTRCPPTHAYMYERGQDREGVSDLTAKWWAVWSELFWASQQTYRRVQPFILPPVMTVFDQHTDVREPVRCR